MKKYPKLTGVEPKRDRYLLVTFTDGSCRLYDCGPLFQSEPFSRLTQAWLFRQVRVEMGGYGVRWNDELDLAESELWEHGIPC
jgi:hypothetical protein